MMIYMFIVWINLTIQYLVTLTKYIIDFASDLCYSQGGEL